MAGVQDLQHILLLYLASILLVTSTVTSSWYVSLKITTVDIRSGLFMHCVDDHCVEQDGDKAVKGMELIGLLASVFCSICMTLHKVMKSKSNSVINALPQLVFFTSIAGAGLVILGCGIFAYEKFGPDIYPSYSFALAVVGGLILIIGGAASSQK